MATVVRVEYPPVAPPVVTYELTLSEEEALQLLGRLLEAPPTDALSDIYEALARSFHGVDYSSREAFKRGSGRN